MWELDCEESWAPKNWCFWTVVLDKTLENPLDCKEIQPVHPKGDQSWVFFGRTDAEAETPVLWPPHAKSWLIGKDPDAGNDWRQEDKGMTEDEMVGWHHWLIEHESGSRRWWRTRKPGMLQSMGLQRVSHDWATEQLWPEVQSWSMLCLYFRLWFGLLCWQCGHSEAALERSALESGVNSVVLMLSLPLCHGATLFTCPWCCWQRWAQHSYLWRWAGIPPLPSSLPAGRIMEGRGSCSFKFILE